MELVAGFRAETRDAAAVAEGDPEIAVRIDGHAIRRGFDVAGGNDAAEVAQVAVVIIEREHLLARGVDVIDGLAIGGPGDAVGIGDRSEGFVDGEIGIEAVEFRVAGFFHETDGASEEAAIR